MPSASLKATRRSISVTRAARIRYSTPKVRTSQDGDPSPLDRGHCDPGPVPPGLRTLPMASMRLATRARRTAGVRPTGIAFRSPVAMIRHRFGGHLRAARTRSCNAVRHAPPLAPSTPWEGTVDGTRARGRRASRASPFREPAGNPGRRSLRIRRSIEHSGGECMKLTKVGAVAASAVFVFAACSPAPAGSSRSGCPGAARPAPCSP